jgi:1-acyl-sn-glycerol-3-phosphate acyltransferase
LPFHANLFEAAIDARVPIQALALRYIDAEGKLASAIEFIGEMSFAQSIIAILRAPKKITAQLVLLPHIPTTGAHRRDLAVCAREAIAEALGYSCPESRLAEGAGR